MTLVEFHVRLGNAVLLYCLALGVWGLWAFFRNQGVGSSYLGAMLVGELLFVSQGAVGVMLLLGGAAPGRWVHILYGVLSVISLPAAFAYLQGQDTRREALVYGLVGLFLAGVALRAMTTAP